MSQFGHRNLRVVARGHQFGEENIRLAARRRFARQFGRENHFDCQVLRVGIHEAKTQLSRLVDEAAKGEPFVIAKAGKPVVKVIALTAPVDAQIRRLGFMAGQIVVPDDFDEMAREEISQLFGGGE